jgi:predicted P-loop ATPase
VTKIYEPGYNYDILPILEGPQGIDKSKALRTLVGEPWFTSILNFFDLKTKEVMEMTSGKWLVELAELSGMTRRNADHIKAQLSITHDNARLAYGRKPTEIGRQWTPVGTINLKQYLEDESGEYRRFCPTRTGDTHPIDLKALADDRDQLFAEAVVAYRNGERPGIPRELWEEGRRQQEEREIDDLNFALIEDWTDKLSGMVTLAATKDGKSERYAKAIDKTIDGINREGWYMTYGMIRVWLNLADVDALRNSRYSKIVRKVMVDKLGWKRGRLDGKTTVFWRSIDDGQNTL